MRFLSSVASVFFNGMLIMFAAPFAHIHGLGYWGATLIGYALGGVISYGTFAGNYAEKLQTANEKTDYNSAVRKTVDTYRDALTK